MLELGWFLLQVCLEGAAGSTWMQRGGKLLGMTLVVLPRTGACILVGMSGLELEVLKLEKAVCLFPRKLRQDLVPLPARRVLWCQWEVQGILSGGGRSEDKAVDE